MRHRVRIQPYLSPEVHQKLRDYASSHQVTESGVAEEALVVRRLDALTQSVKDVQREQQVLAQAVVHVAKFLFRIAAGSAPDAKAQAERVVSRLMWKSAMAPLPDAALGLCSTACYAAASSSRAMTSTILS